MASAIDAAGADDRIRASRPKRHAKWYELEPSLEWLSFGLRLQPEMADCLRSQDPERRRGRRLHHREGRWPRPRETKSDACSTTGWRGARRHHPRPSCCRRCRLSARAGRPPGLDIVLVGDDPASQSTSGTRSARARETGLEVTVHRLPADGDARRAAGPRRHAQSQRRRATASSCSRRCPRPWGAARRSRCSTPSIRPRTWTASIRSTSAVLVQGRAALAPCTPTGVIELLERVRRADRRRSTPSSSAAARSSASRWRSLLLQRDATVTICHSKTPDLPAVAAAADILVAAIGRPAFVTPDFVKPGADRRRRRHQPRDRPRPGRGVCLASAAAARRLRHAAASRRRRRRAPGGRRSRRRADARARRRRPADDRDAAEEHTHRRQADAAGV